MTHYLPDVTGKAAVCGEPLYTWTATADDLDTVDCPDCLDSQAHADTPACGNPACPCWREGHAAAGDALARRMVHDAARAALSGCGVSGGTVCGMTADGVQCPAWTGPWPDLHDAADCPTAPRGQDLEDLVQSVAEGAIAKAGRTGRPMVGAVIDADGIARAARRRWAEHALARLEGRADAFGLDPTDRMTSWAGRYDGAV